VVKVAILDDWLDTLRTLSPRDLFARYYRERHGAELDPEVAKLFDELYEEVGRASA